MDKGTKLRLAYYTINCIWVFSGLLSLYEILFFNSKSIIVLLLMVPLFIYMTIMKRLVKSESEFYLSHEEEDNNDNDNI